MMVAGGLLCANMCGHRCTYWMYKFDSKSWDAIWGSYYGWPVFVSVSSVADASNFDCASDGVSQRDKPPCMVFATSDHKFYGFGLIIDLTVALAILSTAGIASEFLTRRTKKHPPQPERIAHRSS